jgi:hypothetical protein
VSPARVPQDLVEKVDTLVGAAAEPESTALTRDAGLVWWIGPACPALLVPLPWTIYAVSVPFRQISPHDNAARAGFDVVLRAGTAWFVLRRSRYLSTAVLLLAAARFDVINTVGQMTRVDHLLPLPSSCRWRRCACGSAITSSSSPRAEASCGCAETGIDADGVSANSVATWPRGRDHGSSILLRGDQLPCHQ